MEINLSNMYIVSEDLLGGSTSCLFTVTCSKWLVKTPGIAKTLSEFETQIDFVNTIPTDLVGNLYLLERKKMSRKSQKAFATCHGKLNRELLEAKKNQSSNVLNWTTILQFITTTQKNALIWTKVRDGKCEKGPLPHFIEKNKRKKFFLKKVKRCGN